MTEDQRQLLVEILTDTESLDAVTVSIDRASRSVTIHYFDLDDEWFREVAALVGNRPPRTAARPSAHASITLPDPRHPTPRPHRFSGHGSH